MEWFEDLLHGGRYLIGMLAVSAALLASGHAMIGMKATRSSLPRECCE